MCGRQEQSFTNDLLGLGAGLTYAEEFTLESLAPQSLVLARRPLGSV